jgi:hypothetical protein
MEIEALYTAPAHEAGAEVQICNPVTGKKTDFYISVKGVDSKTFREQQRAQQRAIVNALKGKEELKTDEYAVIVECTTGWRGLKDGGKEVPFSKEAARAMYENSPNIAEQVDNFIVNRANFTKG